MFKKISKKLLHGMLFSAFLIAPVSLFGAQQNQMPNNGTQNSGKYPLDPNSGQSINSHVHPYAPGEPVNPQDPSIQTDASGISLGVYSGYPYGYYDGYYASPYYDTYYYPGYYNYGPYYGYGGYGGGWGGYYGRGWGHGGGHWHGGHGGHGGHGHH